MTPNACVDRHWTEKALRYLAHCLSFSSAMTEKEQNIFKPRETKIEKFCPSVVVHKCVPGDRGRQSFVSLSSAWSI